MPISNFVSDLEGWTATNSSQSFIPDGGNPDGHLRGNEGGSGVWYFSAPDAYLGDQSDYYGGSLSFDMRQESTASQFDDIDISLKGGGLTIVLDAGANPGTDWTSYSVSLALGGGWRIGSLSGSVASEDQIRTVLSDLTALNIRGEFVVGTTGDVSFLDNVDMSTAPVQPPEYVGIRIGSNFDTGSDGWSFIADVQDFRWVDAGGNPGGYIEAVDYATGEVWYFVAPEKFRGDKLAYSGGTLEFDLKQSTLSSQFNTSDVVIETVGGTIALDMADNPGLDWTHYALTLDTTSDWRLGTITGAVATQAEIDAVLADITALRIRGEFVTGGDTGGLDNVLLSPSSAAVRVLSDTTVGSLLSNHDTLAAALAATQAGNVVQINKLSAVTQDTYNVVDNGLTVVSRLDLQASLKLDGVQSLTLSGANGLDAVGNARNNTLVGSDGANSLSGLRGRDTLSGGLGRDKLLGGNGNDTLRGEAGIDKLFGGAGNDALFGGKGKDLLSGDAGDDTLTGGTLADTFRFADGFGNDTITDFAARNDAERIDLSRVAAITGFDDLAANHMAQVGKDVVIDALDGNTITLRGVQLADLDASDFLF